MIPDELVEQIRDAADLVAVIGDVVPLKRTGADWRGACPFHGGTHRNFAVIPRKGMYYCYVCHAAGDVFTFLMKRHGLDYPTAVRDVARRVGITVPERGERQQADPREPLFGAAAVAQEWFATRLREGADAARARAYLESRDIAPPVAAELGLGWAPADRSFAEAITALGVAEPVLLEAGLLVKRDDGTLAPRFRSRLLFPIHDLRGRVVGFGGRLLGPGEPKYLNSAESPIFHKGATLYRLAEARNPIRKEGTAVLVEGYFDAIRLALAGIESVVAPLGTALTPDQATLLKRYAGQVILLYDSDGPGLRATFRAADECLRHGLRVLVASLPPDQDPDSLVRTGGRAAIDPILEDAVDVLERKIQLLERKGWFEGVARRRDALDRLLPTVRAASDPIARDLYLGRVAERVGVSRQVLEGELAGRPAPPPAAPTPRPDRDRSMPPRPGRRRPGSAIEERLLRLLVRDPGWVERARREVPSSRFEVPEFREIFDALLAAPAGATPADLGAGLSPGGRAAWQRLADTTDAPPPLDWDAEYAGAIERLEERERIGALPAVADVDARRAQKDQLSPEARERLSWLQQVKRTRSRTTDARSEG